MVAEAVADAMRYLTELDTQQTDDGSDQFAGLLYILRKGIFADCRGVEKALEGYLSMYML